MAKRTLVDTDVMIELLKGNEDVRNSLSQIGLDSISLSVITVMELFYGALHKRELVKIKKSLSVFHILFVDSETSRQAATLIETYAKSHNLKIPDALIAATAVNNDCRLFTFNQRDFRFIPNLTMASNP